MTSWLPVPIRTLISLGLFIAITGCSETHPDPELATTVPQKYFAAQHVVLKEIRGEQVLWSGEATHADGDRIAVHVQNVALTRLPQEPGELSLTVHAPTADLAFDVGRARFDSPRVTTPNGAQFTARRADYNENAKLVTIEGLLEFSMQEALPPAPPARRLILTRGNSK
ncbi:MAG: hypothetical protein R3C68_02520 [Myxococcota bacterium]